MNDLISAAMSKISFYEKLRENAIVTGKKPITLKKYVVDAMDKMLALMIQQHSFRISPPFEIPGICQKCHRELVLKGNDPTNWRFF
ncbi:hypothetical protein MUP77_25345 [Candidatus Bathyarchaeota archaeon]|nr:hypothetical protein [Candidatus Bathyarchaeota archaeon]